MVADLLHTEGGVFPDGALLPRAPTSVGRSACPGRRSAGRLVLVGSGCPSRRTDGRLTG